MTDRTLGKFLLGGGMAGLALTLLAKRYANGVYSLRFDVGSIQTYNGKFYIDLVVCNPTGYTYPVPQAFFNVFDKESRYLGSIANYQLQYIKPGITAIKTQLLPNYNALQTLLTNLVLNSGSITLIFDGEIKISRFGSVYITQTVNT